MPTLNDSEAAGGLLRTTGSLNYKNERGEAAFTEGFSKKRGSGEIDSKEETVPGGGTEGL